MYDSTFVKVEYATKPPSSECKQWQNLFISPYRGSLHPILPATLGPGAHTASNRNEHQKQKKNISAEQSEAFA
jgi:hypothetical protein